MSLSSPELLKRLAENRGIRGSSARKPRSARWRTSDGLRLHYLDWPGGPHVALLLHGGRMTARTFDLLALALGPTVRCIALDLRGHGESSWSDNYSIGRMVSDVHEFVAALGLQRLHLLGMSLGGCVGGHAAPGLGSRLASLTFIDVGPEVNFEATAPVRTFLADVRPAPRIEDIVRRALAVSPRTDPDLMLYRYRALLRCTPAGYYWKADTREPPDFEHILGALAQLWNIAPQICCPALVVKGGRSRVLSAPQLIGFAGRFPQGEYRTLPDAGHNVQEDAPRELAEVLRHLFAKAEGESHIRSAAPDGGTRSSDTPSV